MVMKLVLVLAVLTLVVILAGRLWEMYRVRRRETVEDALKFLWDCAQRGEEGTPEALAGKLKLSPRATMRLLEEMNRRGLIRFQAGRVCLTPAGKAWGLQILRAHRLWERYLADNTAVPLEEIHRMAEKQEHRLSAAEVRKLEADLGYPHRDPHGDLIPDEAGVSRGEVGVPLTDWPVGQPGRIAHIEDEPESIFAQILAEGLLPGVDVVVRESSPVGVRLFVDGNEIWLASIVASRLHVVPAPVEVVPEAPGKTLADLRPGQRARVVAISADVRGLLRRRLLDLGFTRGGVVEVVLRSAFGGGDPTAYRVRGTVIALRREQAEKIFVQAIEERRTQEHEAEHRVAVRA